MNLFPDKYATIKLTFLVEINNCMGNKHALENKASWAGLKEDPVALWDFYYKFEVLSHVEKVVTTYVPQFCVGGVQLGLAHPPLHEVEKLV